MRSDAEGRNEGGREGGMPRLGGHINQLFVCLIKEEKEVRLEEGGLGIVSAFRCYTGKVLKLHHCH